MMERDNDDRKDSLPTSPPIVHEDSVRSLHELAVIAVLADASQSYEKHGYKLKEVLSEYGIKIETGTLYPILRRLEARGFLESTWDTSGSHPRKVYATTEAGRAALEQLQPLWKSFIALIEKVLGEAEGETR